MTHIDLVDQTFRDGQQCLWGMRLRTGMVTPVARELDTAGYSAIDITGSSMFECVLRYSREDPWEGLDHWRRVMPRTESGMFCPASSRSLGLSSNNSSWLGAPAMKR